MLCCAYVRHVYVCVCVRVGGDNFQVFRDVVRPFITEFDSQDGCELLMHIIKDEIKFVLLVEQLREIETGSP